MGEFGGCFLEEGLEGVNKERGGKGIRIVLMVNSYKKVVYCCEIRKGV